MSTTTSLALPTMGTRSRPATAEPTVLAAGEHDGLWLLDAGTRNGVQFTQVLDERHLTRDDASGLQGNLGWYDAPHGTDAVAVLHPPYPLDDVGWQHWYRVPSDPTLPARLAELLADAVPSTDPAVLGRDPGADTYLLNAGVDGAGIQLARIYDVAANQVLTSWGYEMLLKFRPQQAFDGDPDIVLAEAGLADWDGLHATAPSLTARPEPDAPSDEVLARRRSIAEQARSARGDRPQP